MDKIVQDHNSIINEFSILLAIHDEDSSTINRFLEYYSKVAIKIYIADSSLIEAKYNYYANIHYFHLPQTSFINKLSDVLDIIESRYILLTPVDDFCYISRIISEYSSLIVDDSFSYLGGKYESIDRFDFSLDLTNKQKLNVVKKNLTHYELYTKYHFPLLWGIYQWSSLSQLLLTLSKYNFDNDNFIELSGVAILPTIGKVFETNEPFFYRSTRVNSWGNRTKTLTISSILLLKKDQRTYLRLLSEMGILFNVLHYYVYYLVINMIKQSGIKLFLNKMMRKARLQ